MRFSLSISSVFERFMDIAVDCGVVSCEEMRSESEIDVIQKFQWKVQVPIPARSEFCTCYTLHHTTGARQSTADFGRSRMRLYNAEIAYWQQLELACDLW